MTNALMNRAREDFSWLGRVEDVRAIGPYTIVEYTPFTAEDVTFTKSKLLKATIFDEGKRNFGGYINDKKSISSYNTLDECLIGMVFENHMEVNTAVRVSGFLYDAIMASAKKG